MIIKEDFTMNSDGLYCQDIFISPFKPVVKKVVLDLDDNGIIISRHFIIAVELPDGKMLPEHTFDSLEKIPFFNTWKECCDAGLDAKEKKKLHLYLQLQARDCDSQMEYHYNRTGLFKKAFVFGKRHVIQLGNEDGYNYHVDQSVPDFSIGDVDRKMQIEYLSRLLMEKGKTPATMFLCQLFSVIKPLLQNEGYDQSGFIVALYGKSGVGKTQLARTFFVQNSEQEKNFKVNNRNEIGYALDLFSGHTILIDDFHPEALDYGRKRQDSMLDFIARKTDEKNTALSVITAEFLSGCFSIQDRMLQIKVEDVNFETLKYLQARKNVLVSIIKDFAKTVYTKKEETMKNIRYSMMVSSAKANDQRVSFVIRLLKATFEVFCTMCLGKEEIKEIKGKPDVREEIFNYLDDIEYLQIKNMQRIERLEGGIDWLLILYEMLYQDKTFRICPSLDNLDEKKYNGLAVLGSKNEICIRSQTLKKGLEIFLGCRVSTKPLIAALLEEHILDEDKSCSHMKKKLDGKYYYVVNESLLKMYYQNQVESN